MNKEPIVSVDRSVTLPYTDRYCDMINAGQIRVNSDVKKQLEIIQGFKAKYIFNKLQALLPINFIETYMRQTKGGSGKVIVSLPQAVLIENAYGWFEKTTIKRKNPKTYLDEDVEIIRPLIQQIAWIVARGSGKSTMISWLALYNLLVESVANRGSEVNILATTKEQAGIVFKSMKSVVYSSDTTLKEMTVRKKGQSAADLHTTGSGMDLRFEPTDSDASVRASNYDTLDGLNGSLNIFDEIHAYKDDFITIVNDGSEMKRAGAWKTWYISTFGTRRGFIFDDKIKQWRGELKDDTNDHVLKFIYSIEDKKNIKDENNWQMAMPMLGITTSIDTIRKSVKDAQNDPSKQSELLAKVFNLPANASNAYFTNDEITNARKDFNPDVFTGTDYHLVRVILGMDAAMTSDISSVVAMTKIDDDFYFYSFNFTPESTRQRLPKALRDKYLTWSTKGDIIVHGEQYNRQSLMFETVENWITEHDVVPVGFGYDKAGGSVEFVDLFNERYVTGDKLTDWVSQSNASTDAPMRLFKKLMQAGHIHYDNDVTEWNLLNVRAYRNQNGQIKPAKETDVDKIDNFAAMLDCFQHYYYNQSAFDEEFAV